MLDRLVREDLTEKVIFEQSTERRGVNRANIGERMFQRKDSKCKGPEIELKEQLALI